MNIFNSKSNILFFFWMTIPPLGFALSDGYKGWFGLGGWILLTLIGGLYYQRYRSDDSLIIKSSNKSCASKKGFVKLSAIALFNFTTCYIILFSPLYFTSEISDIKGWMYILWAIAAAFYSFVRYKKDSNSL